MRSFNAGKNGVFNLDHIERVYYNPERERFMIQVGGNAWEVDQDKEWKLPSDFRPTQWDEKYPGGTAAVEERMRALGKR
jgi:hypothetical protein